MQMMDGSVAGRLRLAMAARGVTVGRLARRLGKPRRRVECWVNSGTMTAEELIQIVTALNLRGRWLVTGAGLMDATVSYLQITEETVLRLFRNLPPNALEAWVQMGLTLESNGIDPMD